MEESKYLGGDASHTHLVKGLDFALLSKVARRVVVRTPAKATQSTRLSGSDYTTSTFQNACRILWTLSKFMDAM